MNRDKVDVTVDKRFLVDMFSVLISYHAMLRNPDTGLRPAPGAMERLDEWLGELMENNRHLMEDK